MPNSCTLSRLIRPLASPMPDQVQLWLVSLDQAEADWHALIEQLSDDEQRRANAIRNLQSRSAFICMRAALRRLLVECITPPPKLLEISLSERGKPFLASYPDCHFNVSHTSGLGVIALSKTHAVGVDIETISLTRNLTGIAQHFFSERENEWLQQAPNAERFYPIWTAKEALLKCAGTGLANHMREVSNLPLPEGAYITEQTVFPEQTFTIKALDLPTGWIGSVAVSSPTASGTRIIA